MEKELLFSIRKKDFKIQYFSGTGAGGQHRNKHQNCVRLSHPDSGASATGQNSRSRTDNLRSAFKSIQEQAYFKVWLTKKIHETLSGKKLDKIVEEMVKPQNIKVETKRDGKWEEANEPS